MLECGGLDELGHIQRSVQLFEKVKLGQVVCVYSDLTKGELFDAPERVRNFSRELSKENLEVVKMTEEAINLAKSYIDESVVGKTSFYDCVHIALATIHKVDILVSWNFKHIVNIYRIRGYNSVNLRCGYQTLEIRLPRDSISYED